jgi:hypothetical protein
MTGNAWEPPSKLGSQEDNFQLNRSLVDSLPCAAVIIPHGGSSTPSEPTAGARTAYLDDKALRFSFAFRLQVCAG